MGRHLVVIVDDHVLLALGLQSQLASSGVEAVVAELGTAENLISSIASLSPNLVVLDLGLPFDGGGLALIDPIVSIGAAVLVLTGEEVSETWGACLQAGALDVISKGEPLLSIVHAILRACEGLGASAQTRLQLVENARRVDEERRSGLMPFEKLSDRESAVLLGLIEGHSLDKIAARDFVSIETIRTQVKTILRKLDARSQIEAVALAHQAGWSAQESSQVNHELEP